MNAKNGMAFVTKFAPRRACIASPRVRSRGRREVTRNAGGDVESFHNQTTIFRVGTLASRGSF